MTRTPGVADDDTEATAFFDALYPSLAERVSAGDFSCHGCGACCHFDAMDHTLFCCGAEVEYLRRHNGVRPADAAPAGRCPYQVDEHCEAREGRPLGCRLFFCRAACGDSPEKELLLESLSAEFHAALKAWHERTGRPWDYRPFLAALRD